MQMALNSNTLLILSLAISGLLSTVPCAFASHKKHHGDVSIPTNVMYSGGQAGSALPMGESLVYGDYKLKMQKDCNLVLTDGSTAVWQSNTASKTHTGCYFSLQNSGNLMINNRDGQTVWNIDNGRYDSYYAFVVQRDRNLVVYGPPVWATGTEIFT